MSGQNYFAADQEYAAERERLSRMEQRLDPISIRHIEALGVGRGWHCLDVGAGGGSIARWLARRVGPEGSVTATDIDTKFLDDSGSPNLTIRKHDILVDDMEEGLYDLVHCRYVLQHLTDPKKALTRLAASVRPGGWLLMIEGLNATARASSPEHPSAEIVDGVAKAMLDAAQRSGTMDPNFGGRLRELLEGIGFVDVDNEGMVKIVRGGDPLARLLLSSWEIMAPRLISTGLLTEQAWARLKAAMEDSSFYFLSGASFAAWGRRPVNAHKGEVDSYDPHYLIPVTMINPLFY